jgi:hypothetical protein
VHCFRNNQREVKKSIKLNFLFSEIRYRTHAQNSLTTTTCGNGKLVVKRFSEDCKVETAQSVVPVLSVVPVQSVVPVLSVVPVQSAVLV